MVMWVFICTIYIFLTEPWNISTETIHPPRSQVRKWKQGNKSQVFHVPSKWINDIAASWKIITWTTCLQGWKGGVRENKPKKRKPKTDESVTTTKQEKKKKKTTDSDKSSKKNSPSKPKHILCSAESSWTKSKHVHAKATGELSA